MSVTRCEQGRADIDRLIGQSRLERGAPNREHAQALVEQARKALQFATVLAATDDAITEFTAAYDAARKALTAILVNQGLRPGGDYPVAFERPAESRPAANMAARPGAHGVWPGTGPDGGRRPTRRGGSLDLSWLPSDTRPLVGSCSSARVGGRGSCLFIAVERRRAAVDSFLITWPPQGHVLYTQSPWRSSGQNIKTRCVREVSRLESRR